MSDKPNYDAPPDAFPKPSSGGSGGDTLYAVEARLASYEPRLICGQLFDLRWKQLDFLKHPLGVPTRRPCQTGAIVSGLMSYQAAQALRWWFLAQAEVEFSSPCVETRLIEHRVSWTYASQAVRAVAPVGGDDRSGIMWDWGKEGAAQAVNFP